MKHYYNEWDKYAAKWIENLIAAKLIPDGDVDTRSIKDVQAADLKGYTQCHFFTGIAGWPLALKIAGWPVEKECWTGSAPCQPFSVAGKQKAQSDERHLWPAWFNLIKSVKPTVLFGEQVAGAIAHGWLDDAFDDLEGEGYETAACVLPACSVGAPHKRDRLWFVGVSDGDGWESGQPACQTAGYGSSIIATGGDAAIMANTSSQQDNAERGFDESGRRPVGRAWETFSKRQAGNDCADGHGKTMANPHDTRPQGRDGAELSERAGEQLAGEGCTSLADTESERGDGRSADTAGATGQHGFEISGASGRYTNWDTESGIRRVANGIPARASKLRAYGNAIVPQVGAEFIRAFMECGHAT